MSEENKALVQRWFDEVWNKGRADAIGAPRAGEHKLASLSRRFRRTSRATFAYLRSTLESGWWFGVAPN